MSYGSYRSAWAGSDEDVFALLRQHVFPMADVTLKAFVEARGRGADPLRPMFQAHFGDLPFVPGSPPYRDAEGWVAKCDRVVAYLRGRGENILGGVR